MRLRSTLAAAVASLGLLLTLPTSASAANGTFSYSFDPGTGTGTGTGRGTGTNAGTGKATATGKNTGTGTGQSTSGLVNPSSRQCMDVPMTGMSTPTSLRNLTDTPATVYTGAGCTGSSYVLRPFQSWGYPLVNVHSVRFP